MSITPKFGPTRGHIPSLQSLRSTVQCHSDSEINIGLAQPKVLIVQNDLLCNPCTAIASLVDHDVQYQVLYAFHDNAFKFIHPLMYEAIIILGGRAGVYEAHEMKWLKNEMIFIKKCLKLNVHILGICLGCQLLAECCGGKVYAGKKGVEIGYRKWLFHDEDDDENQKQKTKTRKSKKEQKKQENEPTKTKNNPYLDVDLINEFGQFTPNNNAKFVSQHCVKKKDEDDDDHKEPEPEDDTDDVKEIKKNLDPFVHALACQDMARYIVLFHGDTFTLPPKCAISGKKITLLATTPKYPALYRVGKYSYGFQGHPELNVDMLSVWCKCWGDDFLKKSTVDIEKDVLLYAQKWREEIGKTGRTIFDIWVRKCVLKRKQSKPSLDGSINGMLSITEGADSPQLKAFDNSTLHSTNWRRKC